MPGKPKPKINARSVISDTQPDIQKIVNEYRTDLKEYKEQGIKLQETRDYLRKLGVKYITNEQKHLLYREYIKLNCTTKYAALTVIDFNHLLILYNVKPPLNVHEIFFILGDFLFGTDETVRKDKKNEQMTLRKSLNKLVSWRFISVEWIKMLISGGKMRNTQHYKSNMHTSRLLESAIIDYERFGYEAFLPIRRTKAGILYNTIITKAETLEKVEEMTRAKMATHFENRKGNNEYIGLVKNII